MHFHCIGCLRKEYRLYNVYIPTVFFYIYLLCYRIHDFAYIGQSFMVCMVVSLEADSFGRIYTISTLPLLLQVHVVSSNQVVWVSSCSRKRHFICMSRWSEMDEIEYEKNRSKLKMYALWLVYTNQTDGKCRKMINSSFIKIPISTLL